MQSIGQTPSVAGKRHPSAELEGELPGSRMELASPAHLEDREEKFGHSSPCVLCGSSGTRTSHLQSYCAAGVFPLVAFSLQLVTGRGMRAFLGAPLDFGGVPGGQSGPAASLRHPQVSKVAASPSACEHAR